MGSSTVDPEWVVARKRMEQVLPRLAGAFGISARGEQLRPVARGAMGRVWRLDARPGIAYAVKELLWGKPEHDVFVEVSFRDAVAATGVPSPESFLTVDGEYAARLESEPDEVWARLYEWVEGEAVSASDPKTAEWLGRSLARMHLLRVPPSARPRDPWYEVVPDRESWGELMEEARRVGAEWCDRLAARLSLIHELSARVVPPDEAALITCHLDFKPENVLRMADGTHVLLDWDDVGPATPDRELVSVLLRWHVQNGVVDVPAARRTIEAYRRAGGTVRLGPTSAAMQLAMALNHARGMGGAALVPVSEGGDRFAHSEFLATLGMLPSPAVLDQLVELGNA